jgi:hypothetical protein
MVAGATPLLRRPPGIPYGGRGTALYGTRINLYGTRIKLYGTRINLFMRSGSCVRADYVRGLGVLYMPNA